MAENQMEKVRAMLEDFDTALLITHSADGGFRARPMAVAEVDPTCDSWFFPGRDPSKVHEIKTDDRVRVVFIGTARDLKVCRMLSRPLKPTRQGRRPRFGTVNNTVASR